MPKTEIDYSNTIIYKITCKNPNVNDLYVGHTTNFVQRKHSHKQSCINDKSPNYKCKVYEVIRNNGGWDNWNMEIINFFNCQDHYQARQKEQEYFVSLNATLNSIEPMPKPKFKPINVIEKTVKPQFYCEKCDYECFKIYNWKKHLVTSKHSQEIIGKNLVAQEFFCEKCKKCFHTNAGLWKHNKKCKNINESNDNEPTDKELMLMVLQQNALLIKENSDFKNMMMDVILMGSQK